MGLISIKELGGSKTKQIVDSVELAIVNKTLKKLISDAPVMYLKGWSMFSCHS